MNYVIGFYLLEFLGVILCILLGYFIYDKRVNRNHGEKVPAGFQWTEEVNIDPVSGVKTRVYYNPDTGERFYKKEK
ncbi:hypothetical protein [Falsibacillus albus]|uniref:HD family phosphohydrolase n=1 Tax=Falsibacillus albus TaxID=2478915 RepID=A0A3L7JVJ8_9BACI|nr:hypothetical protein [Falsibacillus albus]RLQ93691.1 hypothetical protein D9X91_17070 [Falsibacillus albus]